MTRESDALEIVIHLKNGSKDRFAQPDPMQAAGILDRIKHPSKLFQNPMIMIGSPGLATTYKCDSITRIDLTGPNLPKWHFLQGAERVIEVPMEEYYRERRVPGYIEARRLSWDRSGRMQIGFTEMELVDGQQLVWEVSMHSRELTVMDIIPFTQQLYTSGGLHALHIDGGGVMIINPAHIVRLCFFPGPPKLPEYAWKADVQ